MNIVLRSTWKNIFGKPFRTFIVVLAVCVCSFAALFSLDLMRTERKVLEAEIRAYGGTTDLYTVMRKLELDRIPADLPEYKLLTIAVLNDTIYEDVEGEYQFVTTKSVRISCLDPALAGEMLNLKTTQIEDDEIVLNRAYANLVGAEVGDTVTIHDKAGGKHEYRVREIVPTDPKSYVYSDISAAVNTKGAETLFCGKPPAVRVLIDILDDTQINRAEAMLKEEFGEPMVGRFAVTDAEKKMLNELFGYLFILFTVTLLLVIFVTVSVSERIVGERMSFIGTLRSLGLSAKKTTGVLLAENVMYALLGSILAVVIYVLLRGPLNNWLFGVNRIAEESARPVFPALSPLAVAGVIMGAVLVECLIPLKAVLRAMRVSIRDIIFDNRDTEYKMHKGGIVMGAVLAAVAVVAAIFAANFFLAALCLVAAVMALGLLYPMILKGVTSVLIRIGEKRESAGLVLAAKEAVTKKSTVGSGRLCATSAAMCMIIYLLAVSIANRFEVDTYDCDVIVEGIADAKNLAFTDYLEGVTDREFVYRYADDLSFGEEAGTVQTTVYGMPEGGYRMFRELYGLPERIADDQVYVEQAWAGERGLQIGDPLRIVYNSRGVLPIEREYTIGGYVGIGTLTAKTDTIVVSLKEYQNLFRDHPAMLLVQSTQPEQTARELKKYGVGVLYSAKTKAAVMEEKRRDNATSQSLLGSAILAGVFMSCMGMISNQLVGFEGRKKECAVLLSTTMSRKRMAQILFGEMLITCMTAVTTGTLIGMGLIAVVKKAFQNSAVLAVSIDLHYEKVFVMWGIMLLIFSVTVLFPIRNMKKMRLSEQLKYE